MKDISALQLTKELIQIESTDPGTYEGKIAQFLIDWLSRLPNVTVSKREVLSGRYNIMAELPKLDSHSEKKVKPNGKVDEVCIKSVQDGNSTKVNLNCTDEGDIILICHMDTVVVGEGWTIPPFEAIEREGRIYGRGACDMKSGLACCLSAFAYIALKRHEGFVNASSRKIKLICTVDEEDFMRGVEACIDWGWVKKNDWILDAEPTNGQIQVAHKGRVWYEIEVKGKTAHASTPWKGADANAAMAEIIRYIRLSIKNTPSHLELGHSTVTFGQIEGGYRPYVVPDSCKLWIDMRLVPPTDTNQTRKIVEEAIEKARREVPGITAEYKITGNRPYVERDDNSPLLSVMKKICQDVTNEETTVSYFPGYTDTAVIAGTLHNNNCMSYGPGNLECAHQPDEYVAVEDIIRCEKVYRALLCSV